MTDYYDQEPRVNRDRIEEAVQRALSSRRSPPGSASKIVGSVYNGGAIPTTVPAWFLTHPADFGCLEVEGGACSPTIDATNTVPILVLGPHVPSVGDLLPARMIGGKWVTGSGNGAQCNVTFCAGNRCCAASSVGAGTLIQVYTVGGGTLIVHGTTTAGGCVTLNVGAAGTYDIHITFAGTTTVIVESSQVLTCGGTKSYSSLNPGNVFCCNCCLMNDNPVVSGSGLFLTDALGTINLTYQIGCNGFVTPTGNWAGNVSVPASVVQYNLATNACSVVAGTTNVCYTVTCTSVGAAFSVTVTRTWWIDWCQGGLHLCNALPGAYTFGYCADYNAAGGHPCCAATGGTAAFATSGIASATLAVPSQVTCNPFVWSSALTTSGGPALPDPIGGTVVVQN